MQELGRVRRRAKNSNLLRRLTCLFRVGEFALGIFRTILEALTAGLDAFSFNVCDRDAENEMGANRFVAHKNYDAEADQERKDFDALRIVEEFRELKLKQHSYLCEDASKFREVDSSEHATLVVLNLTHPVGVR